LAVSRAIVDTYEQFSEPRRSYVEVELGLLAALPTPRIMPLSW